jgi:hypothetical protein
LEDNLLPVAVDLHLLDGETIVSPYNCYFIVCIFPTLIALDDHYVLMLGNEINAAISNTILLPIPLSL